MFPVSIVYLPFQEEDANLVDEANHRERVKQKGLTSIPSKGNWLKPAVFIDILERIDETTPKEERGDLLVFLPGINEITRLAQDLQEYATIHRNWIIMQLHSSLKIDEQERVFDTAPDGIRKCILSTNIAETSVTIDGIRFIVDTGKVKEMAYEPTAGLSKLSEFWISQSSAKQRAGRAGRTGIFYAPFIL
jgi:HrpA-like RNA helicase